MFPQNAERLEFGKSFILKTGWTLPNCDDMFTEPQWKLDDFQSLKIDLNSTKHKLNSFDFDKWHEHTSKMNPNGAVINHVRKLVHPDFLTQAWCKFYEIACESMLFPADANRDGVVFNTVHLCEAPGAFVSSLNHFVAINYENVQLKWLATSLNPYHEANEYPDIVTDDRFIRDTLNNWEFGPDYTGNIFQPGYAEYLRQTMSVKFDGMDACLVTADGSIDCSDDPGEQETLVSRLHDYETMIALDVLGNGGSLVLKMFTTFECNTICRLFLLCGLFRSVVVRKPGTSKPGNSEVYVVCTGYVGREVASPYIRQFFAANMNNRRSAGRRSASRRSAGRRSAGRRSAGRRSAHGNAGTFPLSQIPVEFRKQLLECCTYFTELQIHTINHNIQTWLQNKRNYRAVTNLQRSLCIEYVLRYRLRPIEHDQQLRHGEALATMRTSMTSSRGKRVIGSSYEERVRIRHLSLKQEAKMILNELLERDDEMDFTIFWGKREDLKLDLADVQYRLGKPVIEIGCSKFGCDWLIHNRLITLRKFPEINSSLSTDRRETHFRSKVSRYYNSRKALTVVDLIDIRSAYKFDHVAMQYHCLQVVSMALHNLADETDLVVIGYPLLTQLSVGTFYAIASMFDEHGILTSDIIFGDGIIFRGYCKDDGWLDALDKARGYLLPEAHDGLALVSWISFNVLAKENLHDELINHNNLCVVHEITCILSKFETM